MNDLVDRTKALAIEKIGQDAHPSGLIRQLQTYDYAGSGTARFQQHWIGNQGELWLDIPIVEIDVLPARLVK